MSKKSSPNVERAALLAQFYAEISRNSTWTVVFHQAAAHAFGLNGTDHKCRGVLDETGPITAGELAVVMGMSTGAITSVVDRLEHAGLVRRMRDAVDRRRVIIEPVVWTAPCWPSGARRCLDRLGRRPRKS